MKSGIVIIVKVNVPLDQHVGDIFSKDGSVKPISDWDMKKPEPISALHNHHERHQVSLCRLCSKTVKDAGVSQYKHIQGEVNSVRKLDMVCLVSLQK